MEEKILIEYVLGVPRLPRAMNLGKFPDVCRMMSETCDECAFLHLIGEEDTTILLIDDEYQNLVEAADLLGYEILKQGIELFGYEEMFSERDRKCVFEDADKLLEGKV